MSAFLQPNRMATNLFSSSAETLAAKKTFARELARRPHAAWQVALAVFNGDTARAAYVTREWPNDPEVREMVAAEMALIQPEDLYISKAEMAQRTLDAADQTHGKTKLDFYRFYAELAGWIGKDAAPTGTNITNNVIVVPAGQPLDEWQAAALNQQTKLVKDAKVLNEKMTEAQNAAAK